MIEHCTAPLERKSGRGKKYILRQRIRKHLKYTDSPLTLRHRSEQDPVACPARRGASAGTEHSVFRLHFILPATAAKTCPEDKGNDENSESVSL
jgi:hypothetical protein